MDWCREYYGLDEMEKVIRAYVPKWIHAGETPMEMLRDLSLIIEEVWNDMEEKAR